MKQATQIKVPHLVRIKPGALERLGIYLLREKYSPILVMSSPLPDPIHQISFNAIQDWKIPVADWITVDGNRFETAIDIFSSLSNEIEAIVGIGGGKALDVAKYVAFLMQIPYIAVPTSLSNDGFCSPQSSLTRTQNRYSLKSAIPQGVVVDTKICLGAPKSLWLSGVGDLVAKLTAVNDWKRAFHHKGEPVNDMAALLSDATVYQFIAAPTFDEAGTKLLATALMFNGIAMEICGSSRPASGSEHLISHALDKIAARPKLHGLQVGFAAYIVSRLQKNSSETIDALFRKTGFWDAIKSDPFSRDEWLEAVRIAPEMKENYYTILSAKNCLPECEKIIDTDPVLQGCFTTDPPKKQVGANLPG